MSAKFPRGGGGATHSQPSVYIKKQNFTQTENFNSAGNRWRSERSCKHYSYTIRIHNECEGGIEKSVSRITDWHQEACEAMTNGDCERQIFSIPPAQEKCILFLAHH